MVAEANHFCTSLANSNKAAFFTLLSSEIRGVKRTFLQQIVLKHIVNQRGIQVVLQFFVRAECVPNHIVVNLLLEKP